MKSAAQSVVRFLAWLLLMFAVLRGAEVCQGLWQGSGLHGYVIHHGKANSGVTISVWEAFMQALALAGAAGLLTCVFWWYSHSAPAE